MQRCPCLCRKGRVCGSTPSRLESQWCLSESLTPWADAGLLRRGDDADIRSLSLVHSTSSVSNRIRPCTAMNSEIQIFTYMIWWGRLLDLKIEACRNFEYLWNAPHGLFRLWVTLKYSWAFLQRRQAMHARLHSTFTSSLIPFRIRRSLWGSYSSMRSELPHFLLNSRLGSMHIVFRGILLHEIFNNSTLRGTAVLATYCFQQWEFSIFPLHPSIRHAGEWLNCFNIQMRTGLMSRGEITEAEKQSNDLNQPEIIWGFNFGWDDWMVEILRA